MIQQFHPSYFFLFSQNSDDEPQRTRINSIFQTIKSSPLYAADVDQNKTKLYAADTDQFKPK